MGGRPVIPNIVKGSDMRGLVYYLVSTDRTRGTNENAHEDPHVISGDEFVQAWHGAQELDAKAAGEIADYLDRPRQVFGVEMWAGAWEQDPATAERRRVLDAAGQPVMRDTTVWHCSLSLPPGEVLSAEQWNTVATGFMDRMDFTDAGGKSPCRWVAIHHGPGKGGHDHVHIAASMVREDGTKWAGRFLDWKTAQKACRELEKQHGLTEVRGAEFGTAGRGVRPVEAARAAGGMTERDQLAHGVRAAAVASLSEAEWVRRVRQGGMVVQPRFAAGSTDVVVGYRVALRNPGGRLNFYGGRTLGADLSLPRIRETWGPPSLADATAASAEWQAAFRGQRSPGTGRQRDRLRPSAPGEARARLDRLATTLANTPVGDRVAWSHAARDVSGALSAWARFDPQHADQLHTAAAAIARTAQDRRAGGDVRRGESPGMAALVLLAAGGDVRVQAAVMLSAVLRAAEALRRYHRESGNLAEARRLVAAVKPLQEVHRTYAAAAPAQQPTTTGRRAESARDAAAGRPSTRRGPLPAQLGERPVTGARSAPAASERGNDDGRAR